MEKRLSIFVRTLIELDRHKWNEGVRLKIDLSQFPHWKKEWARVHFRGFVRELWVQHLEGKQFIIDFGEQEFDFFRKNNLDQQETEFILNALRCGWEQLNFCRWMEKKQKNEREHFYQILDALNINAHRYESSEYIRDCDYECANGS